MHIVVIQLFDCQPQRCDSLDSAFQILHVGFPRPVLGQNPGGVSLVGLLLVDLSGLVDSSLGQSEGSFRLTERQLVGVQKQFAIRCLLSRLLEGGPIVGVLFLRTVDVILQAHHNAIENKMNLLLLTPGDFLCRSS